MPRPRRRLKVQFPVSVRWRGGRLAWADVRGKGVLEVATPPGFPGGLAGYWSPEEMLVASVASCFALTLASVAERRKAPLVDATITAMGCMARGDDGRFGFTVIAVHAELESTPGGEDAVHAAAREAEDRCVVNRALAVSVQIAVDVAVVPAVRSPTG
jgi:organic hydroperoxide reductase OsmC/OhrA